MPERYAESRAPYAGCLCSSPDEQYGACRAEVANSMIADYCMIDSIGVRPDLRRCAAPPVTA
jgi:hypothetical protein